MNREQAVKYLSFSGFSDEQIKAIEGAFSCPSAGIDCEDCPAYEKKTKRIPVDVLNHWIGAEVLDRIRAEMHATAEKHEDGVYYLRDEWVDEIIDKYMAEGSEE